MRPFLLALILLLSYGKAWAGGNIGIMFDPMPSSDSCIKYLTQDQGNLWKVPDDFDPDNNMIEAIGNGYDGMGDVRAGGGGGGYSRSVNIALNPGDTVYFNVNHLDASFPNYMGWGSLGGHVIHDPSGDSYLCPTSANCGIGGSVVGAQGGFGPVNSSDPPMGYNVDAVAGPGGQASAGRALSGTVVDGPGTLKYSGGQGGNCAGFNCSAYGGPGGGGGAAGPHGDGSAGYDGGVGGAGDAGLAAGGGIGAEGGVEAYWMTSVPGTRGPGGGGGSGTFCTPGGPGGGYSWVTPIFGGSWGGWGGGGGGGGWDGGGWCSPADQSSPGGRGVIVVTWDECIPTTP